jgi:hypothetical protein
MSQGIACRDRAHRDTWEVWSRRCNYSAFSGSRWTPSNYSQIHCRTCGHLWRSKAAYVSGLPDRRKDPNA